MHIIIVVIQLFDIVIHALTNQLEPIRVLSNALVLEWVLLGLSRGKRLGIAVIFGYLILNLAFLVGEGVINPANGEPRIMMFALVALTVILSAVMTYRRA